MLNFLLILTVILGASASVPKAISREITFHTEPASLRTCTRRRWSLNDHTLYETLDLQFKLPHPWNTECHAQAIINESRLHVPSIFVNDDPCVYYFLTDNH